MYGIHKPIMNTSDFKRKITEYLSGLELKKYRSFTMEADGGIWTIRTGMYEDIVEVRVNFAYGNKTMKAFVYEEGEGLLIQAF